MQMFSVPWHGAWNLTVTAFFFFNSGSSPSDLLYRQRLKHFLCVFYIGYVWRKCRLIYCPCIEPQILYDAIKSIVLLYQHPSHSSVNVKYVAVRKHEFSKNAQKLMTFDESQPQCVSKTTLSLSHSSTMEMVHKVKQVAMPPVKTNLEAPTQPEAGIISPNQHVCRAVGEGIGVALPVRGCSATPSPSTTLHVCHLSRLSPICLAREVWESPLRNDSRRKCYSIYMIFTLVM